GRCRSNVWEYAGVNSLKPGRLQELAMHPTVKPVALVADAIKDCSRRNGLVLDPFAGSGTVLIAAERTGRRARALEIDPRYVDVAVRRWETYTGKEAVLAATGPDVRRARRGAYRQRLRRSPSGIECHRPARVIDCGASLEGGCNERHGRQRNTCRPQATGHGKG